MKTKTITKYTLISIGILIMLILLIVSMRNVIVHHYADKKIAALEERYHLHIGYQNMHITGISGLQIDGLYIVPEGRDTLLKAKTINIDLRLAPLLFKKIDIRHANINGLSVQFIKKDTTSNFDFLYQSTEPQRKEVSDGRNYANKMDKTLDLLFHLFPADASLQDFKIEYHNNTYHLMVTLPEFNVENHCFSTGIHCIENDRTYNWKTVGTIQNDPRKITARLYNENQEKIELPFLEYRWNARVLFDSLSFELAGDKKKKMEMDFSGQATVSGLSLFHPQISPEAVSWQESTLDYLVHVGAQSLELDSSSLVKFNKLNFHPYLKVENDKAWHLTASVNCKDIPADHLFSSLPQGLFQNLQGIKTEGQLSYHFFTDIDFGLPDSLKFESSLTPHAFHIQKYGAIDLRKMNDAFIYTAYEKEIPVKSFTVGVENPDFCPLETISPLLQMAVLQSEDGGFYHHQGFLMDALREALIEDLKVGKFIRGGSTISMQLVKNVFLTRNKTIARKLEEALIVWLIENNRLTSKERMFEVYLNIAEWGPGIYGIGEASRFYFNKKAGELTVNEAIFLASIIPMPKRALGCFTEEMQLRPYFESYYRIIAERLKIKGLLSEEEACAVRPEIELQGKAKELLLQKQ